LWAYTIGPHNCYNREMSENRYFGSIILWGIDTHRPFYRGEKLRFRHWMHIL